MFSSNQGTNPKRVTPVRAESGPPLCAEQVSSLISANLRPQSNDHRQRAEKELRRLKRNRTQQYLQCLCQLLHSSRDAQSRAFCAILLRQSLALQDHTFAHLSAEAQEGVREALLAAVMKETDREALAQESHALGQCAAHVLHAKGQWQDLFPALVDLHKSESPFRREAFLVVLERVAEFATDAIRPHMESVRQVLITAFKDPVPEVRVAALRASVSVLLGVDETTELHYFSDMIPMLFQNIASGATDRVVCHACESLQQMFELRAEFFGKFMKPIVSCLGKAVASDALDWDTRRVAMNLLITALSNNVEQCDEKDVARKVIPLAFGFLESFDESIPWTEPSDDLDQTTFIHGTEFISQLVGILGAQAFLAVAQSAITSGLQSQSWMEKMASLAALTSVVEDVASEWADNLSEIVNAVGSCLAHENPRVQYAALQALQRMCVVFAECEFQETYHEPVMAALFDIMDQGKRAHHCVLIQACDTLAHFAYNCEAELFHKYADKAMRLLFSLLKSNQPLVQATAFKAVSVLATVLLEAFEPFYEDVLGVCVEMLKQTAGNTRLDGLRARTFECLTQLFNSVSEERCKQDVHRTMQNLIPNQKKEREAGGTAYNKMLNLFSACASNIGEEFAQYLDHVIPPLIHAAGVNPTKIVDSSETEVSNRFEGNVFCATFPAESKKLMINTAEFEEKRLAFDCLVTYAEVTHGAFLSFVKPVADLTIPVMSNRVDKKMRHCGARSVPALLTCIFEGLKKKGVSKEETLHQCRGFLQEALPRVIECIDAEEDVEDITTMYQIIGDVLKVVESLGDDPKAYLHESNVGEIMQRIRDDVKEIQIRREGREETVDSDDEDYETGVEAELADSIADVIAKLAKMFGPIFVKVFHSHCFSAVTSLFDDDAPDNEITLGLCIFSEVIRYGGEPALQYAPNILKLCGSNLSNPECSAEIRQTAGYAVGVCAENQALTETKQWLQVLRKVVESPSARDEENAMATENCISAIAKICQFQGHDIDVPHVVGVWLQMLPLTHDDDEREFCNGYLLQVMKSSLDALLKAHPSVPAKVAEVAAVAITRKDKHASEFQRAFRFMSEKNWFGHDAPSCWEPVAGTAGCF